MSESDSFLDEVTEEVRRDNLLKVLRRNAVWIIGATVLLVGGIGTNEYLKATARAEAEARGDAMLAALTAEEPEMREDGLTALVEEGGEAEPLARLQLAALLATEGRREDAIAALEDVATTASPVYADLARLKIVVLGAGITPEAERMSILDGLSVEGHPYRNLALEQRAILALEQGDRAAALEDLIALAGADAISQAGRDRALQMITALGGELPDAEPQPTLTPSDG